jgi:hypothetical protein
VPHHDSDIHQASENFMQSMVDAVSSNAGWS